MNKYINKYNKWMNWYIPMCRGRQSRRVGGGVATLPHAKLAVDKLGGVEPPPPDFERISWKIDHICYFVQVISIGGGGGGLAPLNWSNYIVNVFSSP